MSIQMDQSIPIIILMKIALTILTFLLLVNYSQSRWSQEKAKQWYAKYPWSAGFNYVPSYAVNQIQMWEDFREQEISKELKWAQEIGFNTLRIFLHLAPYSANWNNYKATIQKFLKICETLNFKVIFVFFDDCWRPTWASGKQPDLILGEHNSQWIQCPGAIQVSKMVLQRYVKDIIEAFKANPAVVVWDIYNEVGYQFKTSTLQLAKDGFKWARQLNPPQPITSSIFANYTQLNEINKFLLDQSDIISFHNYRNLSTLQEMISDLKIANRPIICTQYLARPIQYNSSFFTHLPVFKENNIWAINWGFVAGKTQTYLTWKIKMGYKMPEVWLHDVVYPNGKPYDQKEVDFIRNITRR